jgi:ketosteroid isomerase-like protein
MPPMLPGSRGFSYHPLDAGDHILEPTAAGAARGGGRMIRGNPAAIAADAVLAANRAFYDAFNSRDIAAMEQLWSRESPVACIHPGWAPLTDRDQVLAAWRAILSNPDSPELVPEHEVAMLWGDMAMVVCCERLGDAVLAATNLFRLEEGFWRMVHHQAGPAAEEVARTEEAVPSRRRLH